MTAQKKPENHGLLALIKGFSAAQIRTNAFYVCRQATFTDPHTSEQSN